MVHKDVKEEIKKVRVRSRKILLINVNDVVIIISSRDMCILKDQYICYYGHWDLHVLPSANWIPTCTT